MLENATYTSGVGVMDAANVTTHALYTDVNTPAISTAVNTPAHTAAINSTVDGVVSHLLPVSTTQHDQTLHNHLHHESHNNIRTNLTFTQYGMLPLPLTTFGSSNAAGVVLLVVIMLAVTAITSAIIILRWKHNKRYVTYARFNNTNDASSNLHLPPHLNEESALSSVRTIASEQMSCPLTGGAACLNLQTSVINGTGGSTAAVNEPNALVVNPTRTSFVGMNRPLLTENSRI